MTNQQICDFYDNNPNLTIAQLAQMLRMTTDQVKAILQTPPPVQMYGRNRGRANNYRG